MATVDCPRLRITALREQMAQWEGAARRVPSTAGRSFAAGLCAPAAETVSSGLPALDRILPDGGFRRGTLVEWLGEGAAMLTFRAAAVAARGDRVAGRPPGAVVVLDRGGEFYPPAAVALGMEPAQLIIVHPSKYADHAWALDQALRCPAVAAIVAWPDGAAATKAPRGYPVPFSLERKSGQSPGEKFDSHAFRRLQLAAEQGGGVGMLVRPPSARGEPSWADVRLLVEPRPCASPYGGARRLRVIVLRGRGGRSEQCVEVEFDDETPALPVY